MKRIQWIIEESEGHCRAAFKHWLRNGKGYRRYQKHPFWMSARILSKLSRVRGTDNSQAS